MKTGVIVLGHGSRATIGEANKMIFEVADFLKEKDSTMLVETAIANRDSGLPGIEEGIIHLLVAGAEKIVIAPLFLAQGMHVRSGIPAEIDRLRAQYSQITIALAEPLGADPRLADILLERIQEVQGKSSMEEK
jgi:sirohydrochlorin ferrochelatase